MTTFAEVFALFGQTSDDSSPIKGVSASDDPRPETLSFMTTWLESFVATVLENPRTLFLVPTGAAGIETASNVIAVDRPRLAYALALRDCLTSEGQPTISPTAFVDESAILGEGVAVGHFAVIEAGVVVGPGTQIDHHVVLKTGVELGANVRIGSHTAVGGAGFGFELDASGTPIRIGHRGGVVVANDVEIGHHCSIAQGTINPTYIGPEVKIDDCVFIAHNVSIGAASYIIAGAELSGSVNVGERVWISPQVSVINKVSIGDDALVGIGAVVVSDVAANTIVAGVPAKPRGLRHEDEAPRGSRR